MTTPSAYQRPEAGLYAPLSTAVSVPSSTFTRPANTTGYTGTSATPQLVASSTTAGSVVVPSFPILNVGGVGVIPRCTLSTNITTGWGNVSILVTLYTAAPTFTNGDGGTYALATGAAKVRAQYSGTFTQDADGATCALTPLVGNAPAIAPAAAGLVYWDLQIQSSATPISGQTFTLIPEIWN